MKNTKLINKWALEAAFSDGWELDSSPGTEMSNDTWYRWDACTPPVREEDLIERYSAKISEASMKAAEKIASKFHVGYDQWPYIAALIDEELAADKRMHALEQQAEMVAREL